MDLSLNAKRFTGSEYLKIYNQYRPTPPPIILEQSLNYLDKNQAEQIVDLGCGTGLSTKSWSPFSKKVVGIEPSEQMVAIAKYANSTDNTSYQVGYANDIPLPSNSSDIVSCSQSFHWMEPKSSLTEIQRILKPKGVLIIYDVFWPPTVNEAYEKAYKTLFKKVDTLTKSLNETIAHRWDKQQHFNNVQKSQLFQFSKESFFHKTIPFSKEQFIGIALSQGGLEALLKRGFSPKQIGIEAFKTQILELPPPRFEQITYNYKVIFAIK